MVGSCAPFYYQKQKKLDASDSEYKESLSIIDMNLHAIQGSWRCILRSIPHRLRFW